MGIRWTIGIWWTRGGLVFGTPDYMSPEQVRGKVVDARSDIFSLGAVFYQILSGRKPFAAKALPEVMRKVLTDEPARLTHDEAPPSLARIVTRSLQKDPLKRYQEVGEILADLRGVDPEEAPDTESSTDEPRQIDRYEVLERVGRGGMGVVYRARDPVLDRDVAIKSLLVDFGVDQDARARFQQEARAAARLQHPNIVTIFEFGEKDDSPYLIMEFLGGDDLEGLIKGDPLSLVQRLDIVAQLCDGLAFAHEQGVVHRDIKPGNVRVLEDGTVKLLDFGIAKVPKADASSGMVGGSAGYVSPEQLSMEPVDARSDLFSVGVLAYELLTGRQPFTGDSAAAVAYQVLHEEPPPARSLAPQLPEALEAVLARALQKKPDKRWSSAQELGEAFRDVARAVAQTAAPRRSGQARGAGGPRSDRVGHLDLRVASGKTGDQLADASLPEAATAPAVAARPRSRMLAAAVVVALVAAAGVGGYYAYQTFGNGQSTEPVDDVGAMQAAAGAAGGGGATVPPDGSPPATGDPAEPVPVAPPVPELVVTSTPFGAAVSLDGQDTGQITPASFELDEPYPETVALSLDGYEPVSQEMPPVEGDVVEVPFGDLTQTRGRIGLPGDYPFEVWINGRQLRDSGDSRDITEWPTGSVTVYIQNEALFLDHSVTLRVVEDETVELDAPALGSLSVRTTPGNCEIFVNSRSLGFPPIPTTEVAPVPTQCRDSVKTRFRTATGR